MAASAGDVVSEGRGVSAGREWSGVQPPAGLLPQQRGKTLVFHFYLCVLACKLSLAMCTVSDWKLAKEALEQGYINELHIIHCHSVRSATILGCLFVAIETGGRRCG